MVLLRTPPQVSPTKNKLPTSPSVATGSPRADPHQQSIKINNAVRNAGLTALKPLAASQEPSFSLSFSHEPGPSRLPTLTAASKPVHSPVHTLQAPTPAVPSPTTDLNQALAPLQQLSTDLQNKLSHAASELHRLKVEVEANKQAHAAELAELSQAKAGLDERLVAEQQARALDREQARKELASALEVQQKLGELEEQAQVATRNHRLDVERYEAHLAYLKAEQEWQVACTELDCSKDLEQKLSESLDSAIIELSKSC